MTNQNELFNSVNTYQGILFAKLLAGKLNEAWKAITASYFKKGFLGGNISVEVTPSLDEESKMALKELKSYFILPSDKCLLRKLRDDFSFHYSADDVGGGWSEIKQEGEFKILMGDCNGNTFHFGGELAATSAMLKAIDPDRSVALQKFFEEIGRIHKLFSVFLDGSIYVLVNKCKPEREVKNLMRFRTDFEMNSTVIPFFCYRSENK